MSWTTTELCELWKEGGGGGCWGWGWGWGWGSVHDPHGSGPKVPLFLFIFTAVARDTTSHGKKAYMIFYACCGLINSCKWPLYLSCLSFVIRNGCLELCMSTIHEGLGPETCKTHFYCNVLFTKRHISYVLRALYMYICIIMHCFQTAYAF